jgi:aminoglycoside/choline kinase family phosphotransferase
MWERAIDLAVRPASGAASGFIHRDYHPGNVLWTGAPDAPRVAGVADWTSASIGPFAIDLGHMRWNLAAGYDRATADRFLAAAQALGLADDFTPEWDIRSTLDVLPELRLGHDSAVSLRRTEQHVARALAELG